MNIVVAVDFSEVTPRVLAAAAEQARGRDAQLWLVHVAPPEPDFVGYDPGPSVVRGQVAEELREERRALEQLADELRAQGLAVTSRFLRGPTVQAILEYAAESGADLIVMGTHGRSLVHQVLVGSVSEGVLRGATRPLLLVPAKTA